MLYDFTFVIEGANTDDDDVVSALTEHLDATLARGAGVDLLIITADGIHAIDAARNAIASVKYIAPQIEFLYLDRDLVGISEIASRAGRTRQNVTQWVLGERQMQASPFPKVEGVVGRARIWLWSEVNSWLQSIGLGDRVSIPRRYEMTDIDFMIRHKFFGDSRLPSLGPVWPSVHAEAFGNAVTDAISGVENNLRIVVSNCTIMASASWVVNPQQIAASPRQERVSHNDC